MENRENRGGHLATSINTVCASPSAVACSAAAPVLTQHGVPQLVHTTWPKGGGG